MWKYAVLVAAAAAIAVAAVAFAASGDDGTPQAPPPPPPIPAAAGDDDLERARKLIRDCRVRSTVSLHSGAFYLELKDGSQVDIRGANERTVYAELQRATKRCGPVTVAME
jgi:hypothetical protein